MPGLSRTMRVARYEITNNIGIAIIAMLNTTEHNDLFDWTAYIGVSACIDREESGTTATRRWGNKLRIEDAHHYFPHLSIERYRE